MRTGQLLSDRRGRRRLGLAGTVAAAGAAAVLIGGCGGTSSVANAIDPVAQAASVTNAATGYRMQLTMRMASAALPGPITATGTGSFTPGRHTGAMKLAMGLPGSSGQSLTVQEVLEGQTVYVKLPASVAGHLPGGKPWLKIDAGKVASAEGIPGSGSLLNSATSNPAQMLQYLHAVSGSVTKLGAQTIDGVPTTHYRATIVLSREPRALPAGQRAAAQQAIAALKRLTSVKTIPIDVWIDGHHLVRRMAFSLREKVPTTGQALALQATVGLSDYGLQPAPTVPPASQVTDLSSALAGAASQGGTA